MRSHPGLQITNQSELIAFEETPLGERFACETTYDILKRSSDLYGKEPAIQYLAQGKPDEKPEVTSFFKLFSDVTQVANLFHRLQLASSDAVSLLLPNIPEYYACLFGAEANSIANPINPMLSAEHTTEILKTTKSKALITLAPNDRYGIWDKLQDIAKNVESLRYIITIARPECCNDHANSQPPLSLKGIEILALEELLSETPSDSLESGRCIKGCDIAAYFHTGGTTGTPKVAQHSHYNQAYLAWAITAGSISEPISGRSSLSGLPLFHVNAVLVGALNPFLNGASVILLTPDGYRNPNIIPNFWHFIERFKAYTASAVPTVYTALLDVPSGNHDLSSIEYLVSGAAPMPPEVFRQFETKTNLPLVEGYGLTEGTCVSTKNPPAGIRKIGSVGMRLPYQQLKTAILDDNNNHVRDCKPDEIGNVLIKGPNVFPGYLQEQENAKAFVGDEWLDTGDMGRIDADGYLWLTGRSKDIIIRGGHNIDPAIIEDALSKHPNVKLSAAVGKPDPRVGELPVAFVKLGNNTSISAKQLKDFVRENISEKAAAPVDLHIVDEIPMTAVGKIFKVPLKNQVIHDTIAAALKEAKLGANVTVQNNSKDGITVCIALENKNSKEKAQELLSSYTLTFNFKP